jgi:hypothetical protein
MIGLVRARLLTIGLLASPSIAAAAEPPVAEVAAPAESTDVPEAPVAAEPAAAPAVPDAAWEAVRGKQVTIATADGDVEGELATTEGDTLVVIADDGTVQTVPKASAKSVRVRKVDPPAPSKPEIAPPVVDEKKDEKKKDEEKSDDEKKDKKKKREHALLGAFTAQGAAYSHWRGDGVNAGHAAYAMDFGIGVNPTPGFGMYAMGGGLLAAKIENKTIRGNYGHLAFMFAFGGKYYHSMIGAGVAFDRLKFDDRTEKGIGLSLPMKLFGKLPLPKHLYLGIGLSYELGMVRGFSRFVNGIGGQIVFGRW